MGLKFIICGYAQHGKDTVAEMLTDLYYMSYKSSSQAACEIFLFDRLAEKYGYSSIEECYNDRVNHRKEWYDEIVKFNTPDLTALGTEIFKQYDIYCGLRNIEELKALKDKFDPIILWVDAEKRKGITETKDSITITGEDCDYVIDNNSTIDNLMIILVDLVSFLTKVNI